MLIPSRPDFDLSESDVESIINNKVIDFSALDGIIPKGVTNTWTSRPGDRIKYGFKYEWNQLDGFVELVHWHVHGHAPDPLAPGNSNASNGWVVRIKRKNRWLLESSYIPERPGPPQAQNWGTGRRIAGMTHIATTNQAIADGRGHEAPEAAVRVSGTNIPINQGLRKSFS